MNTALYWTLTRHSFRRYGTYVVATAAGAITNTVFGCIRAFVLIALWHARPVIGGYDVVDAVTFCFLSQALIAPLAVFAGSLELAERIRTGAVAVDLYRPADLQGWWLAGDLGRAAYHLIARGLPPLVFGAVFFELRRPPDVAAAVGFAVSVVLAVVVSFALRYLAALSAFWLLDERGVAIMLSVAAQFFGGLLLPLVLFPGWLGTLAHMLPWYAVLQIPADIWLGQHRGLDVLSALGIQVLWAAILLGIGRLLGAAAYRRVVVQGG